MRGTRDERALQQILHGWFSGPRPAARQSAPCAAAAADPSSGSPLDETSASELEESQARLQVLFEGLETGIFLIDPATHTLLDANQVAAQMVGLPREKIVGCSCHKFVCPAETGRCPVTDLGQTVDNTERLLLTAAGGQRSIIKTVRTVTVSGRSLLLESFIDITARKQAETALKERTAYLNSLIEVSPLGIVVLDGEGRIELLNPAFERLFLYMQPEYHGGRLDDLIIPAELADEAAELNRRCTEEGSAQATTRRRRKDGVEVDVRIFSARLEIDGKARGLVALYEDIGAQIEAERSLRLSEDRFRTAFEEAPYGMCLVAPDGRFLFANTALIQMLGYTRKELIAGAWQQITHPDDLERSWQAQIQLKNGARTVEFEKRYLHKNGSVVWVRLKISPVIGPGGEPGYYITQIEDITARRHADEAQAFLASLVESSQDAIVGETLAGEVMSWNRGAEQLYGYTAGEMIGQPISRLVPADRIEEFRQVLEQTGRGEAMRRYETVRVRKDGTPVDVMLTVSPVRDAAGKVTGIVTITHDITARKRAELALRENEERYRELFENASEIIYTTDLEARFTSMNLAGQQLSGYSQEEAAGMNVYAMTAPEHWKIVNEMRARMFAGETGIVAEIDIRAKDGRRLKLEVKPRLIVQNGKPVGVQTIARDITGRDLAETELRQAQKLESVGRLAAGIAHEINTPIQFVGDNTRFLRDAFVSLKKLWGQCGELIDRAAEGQARADLAESIRRTEAELDCAYLDEEIPRALAQSLEGVDRVATIVRALKEFAHPEGCAMAAADLNKALQSTMTVARNELKYVSTIKTEFGDLPLVVCNVSDLNQVFLNLLINAAHAIADVVKPGEKGLIAVRTAVEGDKVLISISDTGSGIPESIRPYIFDPFFTTKEVGRGTGQGLAIARSVVVERHKGTLTFESEVGKGTTFFIRLPVAPEAIPDENAAGASH